MALVKKFDFDLISTRKNVIDHANDQSLTVAWFSPQLKLQFVTVETMFLDFLFLILLPSLVNSVQKCYIGALEVYENPRFVQNDTNSQNSKYFWRTLTMLDLMEVNTYKLMDCNLAHHPKEIVQ